MAKNLDFKDFLTVDYAPGMPGLIKKNAKKRKSNETQTSGPSESVEVEEALNPAQRRARGRLMKRLKSRIAVGRKRAANRMADPKRLMKRARKAARTLLLKKITKGIPKEDLTFARRQEIEKRLDKMGPKIEKMATRLLPQVRKKEMARHQSKNSEQSK